MAPLALTCQQSREIDRIAIEQYGIPGLVLMENAGRGCVDLLERLGIDGRIVIFCGKGNNAGDGFVIARHLDIRGYSCRVLLLSPPAEFRGDAATNFAILQTLGVEIIDMTQRTENSSIQRAGLLGTRRGGSSSTPVSLAKLLNAHATGAAWLVDALLGTGATGEPRPPYDSAIDWFNAQPAKKLAVDVPSGLDCDTGQPAMPTIRADHTCTFAAMKIGYLQPAAKEFTGTVHVCDIGVSLKLISSTASNS